MERVRDASGSCPCGQGGFSEQEMPDHGKKYDMGML